MARRRSLSHPSLVLFACLFASQSGMLVLSPILVDVAREFGVSTATAGQLRSISGATGRLTALVVATATRRPGLRELLSLGAALVALGSGLSAAAPSFTVLSAAQAVLANSGALLLENYWTSPAVAALGLGLVSAAMLPGTFTARRRAADATHGLPARLTAFQSAALLALGALRSP
jgi:hypothetical protein